MEPEEFFDLFDKLDAEPRWVNSDGVRSIQIIGLCHHGESHSAVFNPERQIVTCFSECGGGMKLHTWVKRVLDLDSPLDAKDYIEKWIANRDIDFSDRTLVPKSYIPKQKEFERKSISPVAGIPKETVAALYSQFDTRIETLNRLVWHTEDGILPETMAEFDVAAFLERGTIILPHHNINGEIVGLYERSFLPLRRDIKKWHPDAGPKFWYQFPTAKYLPLLKADEFLSDEDKENREKGKIYKSSWSFPNSFNLYGLHKAKDGIRESKVAIVFEGAKSVMLAWQMGHRNCVASHTFGMDENHVNMLLDVGATEIWLAFDRQYKTTESDDKEWERYDKRTYGFACKIGSAVDVYRICDTENLLDYKDAPIDKGQEVFEYLLAHRQPLFVGGEDVVKAQRDAERQEAEAQQAEALAEIGKRLREERAAAGTLPLPRKEFDETPAPPIFRGLPIKIIQKVTESEGKRRSENFIQWGDTDYKQEQFFAAAYGDQYHTVKEKTIFKGQAADDVLRLTGPQRTKLMFNALAARHPLQSVSEQDIEELKYLCGSTEDNDIARNLFTRLNWERGLSKIVTFGLGTLDAGAKYTWCYKVEYQRDRAVYQGQRWSWENWQTVLRFILDDCRERKDSFKTVWEKLRPALYYQNGMRLTLSKEDSDLINEWVYDYTLTGSTPFPLQGEIPGGDYAFTIDYAADVEYVPTHDLRGAANMAAFNRETNKERNAQKGKARVQERFSAACGDLKPGDTITTAQLKGMGYTDDKAIRRAVEHGVLERLKRGVYVIKSV